MLEGIRILTALLAGIVLGLFFFGGLWWTVRRGIASKQPAVLFLGSLLLRTLLVVLGFYFVARSDWRNLVASLAGFLLARIVMTRTIGHSAQTEPGTVQAGAR